MLYLNPSDPDTLTPYSSTSIFLPFFRKLDQKIDLKFRDVSCPESNVSKIGALKRMVGKLFPCWFLAKHATFALILATRIQAVV